MNDRDAWALETLKDVKGLGPGVCAGCGGWGPSLLLDSIGHWCENHGGAGTITRPAKGEVA